MRIDRMPHNISILSGQSLWGFGGNCGVPLTGHYCAQCGQAAVDYRRSFRHVMADVLDSFLNWDSKFFATIALLILKPWRLTNEFLAGKRVEHRLKVPAASNDYAIVRSRGVLTPDGWSSN